MKRPPFFYCYDKLSAFQVCENAFDFLTLPVADDTVVIDAWLVMGSREIEPDTLKLIFGR